MNSRLVEFTQRNRIDAYDFDTALELNNETYK